MYPAWRNSAPRMGRVIRFRHLPVFFPWLYLLYRFFPTGPLFPYLPLYRKYRIFRRAGFYILRGRYTEYGDLFTLFIPIRPFASGIQLVAKCFIEIQSRILGMGRQGGRALGIPQ